MTVPDEPSWDDPRYLAAVAELLGLLACTQLVAFQRLASDCDLAPTIGDEVELATMAAAEARHVELLRDRLWQVGVDPDVAMTPYVSVLHDFHVKTAPADWYESLVKAYVGDGIGVDFYRELAELVDPATRALVEEVCDDSGHSEFAVTKVRAAIAADHRLAGRLALWGRRLVGEALTQAGRVASDREALTALVLGQVGESEGLDLAGLGALYERLTAAHSARMVRLGLEQQPPAAVAQPRATDVTAGDS